MAKKKGKSKQSSSKRTVNRPPENEIRASFRFAQKQIAERSFKDPKLKASLDLDSARTYRRIKAAEAYAEEVAQRVTRLYPDTAEYDWANDWAQVSSYPRSGYDAVEEVKTVTMAIAIWILDQLREHNQIWNASDCLLTDAQLLSEVAAPSVWDPCHSEDLILSMMEMIQSRNDDCISKSNGKKPLDTAKEPPRFFMDICTAERCQKQTVPSRERFDYILSLIPEEAKTAAADAFTEKAWEWLERYFACRIIYARQELQHEKDSMLFLAKTRQTIEDVTKTWTKNSKAISGYYPRLPSEVSELGNILLQKYSSEAEMANARRIVRQFDAEQDELDERAEEIQSNVSDLWFYLRHYSERSYEESVELLGKEIADIWADFSVDNPYELAFGFLYLLDNGSDLPWLYFPCVNLFEWIGDSLPWARMDYDFGEGRYWDELTENLDMHGVDGIYIPKKVKLPELENWYRLDYTDRTDPEDYQPRYNLAQIMYRITGSIMPRKPERYLPALDDLCNYGITGKKAIHPLMYCMSILGEARNQSHSYVDEENISDEPQEQPVAEAEDPEKLKKELAAMRKENEQLRSTLYHTGSELRGLKKKQEESENKASLERQELADLRELVFHQQEGTYEEDAQDPGITFPCRTTQRIVVFGGHDSWAREIKQKLPDVRFVDRSVIPNSNLIRNADVVWVQSNAISHAFFYKIIDEVRKHNVPMRYFSYASAVKCAEQIVQMDQGK